MGRSLYVIIKRLDILAGIPYISKVFLYCAYIHIVIVAGVARRTHHQHLWQTLENPLDEIIQAHSVVQVTVSQAQLSYEA